MLSLRQGDGGTAPAARVAPDEGLLAAVAISGDETGLGCNTAPGQDDL
jgi:hypothetical protein